MAQVWGRSVSWISLRRGPSGRRGQLEGVFASGGGNRVGWEGPTRAREVQPWAPPGPGLRRSLRGILRGSDSEARRTGFARERTRRESPAASSPTAPGSGRRTAGEVGAAGTGGPRQPRVGPKAGAVVLLVQPPPPAL